jgi:hypothetical protein
MDRFDKLEAYFGYYEVDKGPERLEKDMNLL